MKNILEPFMCISILRCISDLTFPPLSTLETRDKCRHGFICRTRLKLRVCAFVRLAFATREQVGGRLNFKLILVLVAILLVFNNL